LFPYGEVLREANKMLPRSLKTVSLLWGAKMSKASEAALKACVGEVVAFPAFTSFSEENETAKEFPCEQPGPDEVKVFFQLDCQGASCGWVRNGGSFVSAISHSCPGHWPANCGRGPW
jgi:hypothetical protein